MRFLYAILLLLSLVKVSPGFAQARVLILPPVCTAGAALSWLGWGMSTSWSSALESVGVSVIPPDSVVDKWIRLESIDEWSSESQAIGQALSGVDSAVIISGFFYLREDTIRMSLRMRDELSGRESPVILVDGPYHDLSDVEVILSNGLSAVVQFLAKDMRITVNADAIRKSMVRKTRPASFFRDNTKAWLSFAYQDVAECATLVNNRALEAEYLKKADQILQGTDYTVGNKRLLLAGIRAMEKKQFTAAIQPLQDYLSWYPDDLNALRLLCSAQQSVGHTEQALVTCGRILERAPSDLDALLRQGSLLLHQMKFIEAKSAYSRVVELNPSMAEAYSGLGLVDWQSKKKKMALRYFEKALSLDSLEADAHYGMGMLLSSKKKKKVAAIHHLEQSLRLRPNRAEADEIRQTIASLRSKKKK